MKKIILLIFFAFTLVSFVSSEIILTQQPNEIYNIDDSVTIPVIIKATNPISEPFNMDLICNGKTVNFYKNGVHLTAGEEKTLETSLILTKALIGETTGACKIKGWLGDKTASDYIITEEFKISNLLTIQPNTEQKEFEPGQSILISGSVIKENGQDSSGFIGLEITTENSSENMLQTGTISNGFYSINITFPENMKAGNYLVKLNAYEIDSKGIQTNKGFSNYNLAIKQVPRSLEVAFETNQVEPGTNVKIKAILHDQTGDKISSTSLITIKKGINENTAIKQQSEVPTDEFLEYPIAYNEPPSNWTVFAVSNQLTAESKFIIKEKRQIEAILINDTIIITNKGNVPYNQTVFIKIGNETKDLDIFLNVDEEQKYVLKGDHNGEFEIEFIDEKGESRLKGMAMLTGKSIDIKEITKGDLRRFVGSPIVWIFIVFILGFVAFIIFKKGYKRSFFGQMRLKKKVNKQQVNTVWENRAAPLSKNSKLEAKNKANLSLSIKGNKQEITLVAIKIKNLEGIQSTKGNAEETLQKIVNFAEDKKAFIYENQDNLFFILTPLKTRTFQNEANALNIAQKAKEILIEHNKLFKQKISFGISMENGEIVEKLEGGILEFMSMGTFMTNAKRIASTAQEDILLGEKIRGKLTNVRTEKINSDRVSAYKIKEIKYHDEEHSRFIKSFLQRTKEDKK